MNSSSSSSLRKGKRVQILSLPVKYSEENRLNTNANSNVKKRRLNHLNKSYDAPVNESPSRAVLHSGSEETVYENAVSVRDNNNNNNLFSFNTFHLQRFL